MILYIHFLIYIDIQWSNFDIIQLVRKLLLRRSWWWFFCVSMSCRSWNIHVKRLWYCKCQVFIIYIASISPILWTRFLSAIYLHNCGITCFKSHFYITIINFAKFQFFYLRSCGTVICESDFYFTLISLDTICNKHLLSKTIGIINT
jgi:hypothetical protein